ncbi:FecR domain-containing protein [Mucilaginibacter sp. SMC90]|uniref:FecR family protein n=1 Tax=Mucilaginibacter sp. SMC90 TaxID=2929803 RepID=UPI001FB37AB2|nr:FecR family protein [Mucilaginibacter sp. SMC90]UOE46530.1 FecR domain-containing protein [Mucilaginibacter sp. SMC90]
MNMSYEDFKKLHERCTSGNCTPEEQKIFEEYRDNFDLSDTPWLPVFGDKAEIEKLLKNDLHSRLSKNKIKKLRSIYWPAAAAILVFALAGLFVANKYFKVKGTTPYELSGNQNEIKPGSNKAVLTLADGKQIKLDSSRKGRLFTLNNVTADNDVDSSIIYKKNTSAITRSPQVYNIISTPQGGKYQLILADGTKVWLNAGTTIRFPIDFRNGDRVVELSGEAYFEVAHDASRPFKVTSAGQVVQVLGTHFNINAYADNGVVKTTLLQGRVKVYGKDQPSSAVASALIIKPNEQAVFKGDQFFKVAVDAEEFVAWKRGVILFRDADIHDVMRKISRWYDVEVVYQGQMSKDTYSGEISRNAAFSEVLKILKLDDINVKVSGRKLIVSQ